MPIRVNHAPGVMIAAIVTLAQFEIYWFLSRDWRKRLPHRFIAILRAFLYPLWFLTGLGISIDLLALQYAAHPFTPRLTSLTVAISTLWGFTSAIAINIYALASFLRRRASLPESPSRRMVLRTATTAAMAAPFALAGFGSLVERTRFVVKEIDLPIPHLHPDLDGIRVAQISDLHVSPFLSVKQAGRVVDMTNELRPNLTLVTGDLITQAGDPLDATIAELGRLRAEAGVIGCLGNHEVYARCEDYATKESAKVGLRFLRQQQTTFRWGNGVLNIAGVDFQSFRSRKGYLPGAERLVLPGMANVLLSHNPDVFPVAVRAGYDAVIGGHTHGGQVTVEILQQTANLARFFTPYVAGLYRLNGRSCYVNAGIGTIGMPVRLGAPPEITLFRLRRA